MEDRNKVKVFMLYNEKSGCVFMSSLFRPKRQNTEMLWFVAKSLCLRLLFLQSYAMTHFEKKNNLNTLIFTWNVS